MATINRLDPNLTNMIAAGEVVERPSGVVKELVENAIDAHASIIDIDITQGGIESIIISDNGEGMSPRDASLAFERHATSKIKKIEDLWNITSLGFRGEALPSIASVAKVNMHTSDGNSATEITIHYGKTLKAAPCAFDQGTRIQVDDLFQKMPARFKHLKSPNYEFSLISDVINKFALANPHIAFNLTHNGNTILKTYGRNNLQEVILQEFDRSIASNSIKVEKSDNDFKVEGYIVQPSISRASKYYINIFVNKRMIRSYRLNQAIIESYSEYLPKDRYPIVFLNLEMDANLVDVNVHPSKWEVRFSKEGQLKELISEAIKEALNEHYSVNKVKPKHESIKVEEQTIDFNAIINHKVEPIKPIITHEAINESFIKEEMPKYESETVSEIKEEVKPAEIKDEEIKIVEVVTEKPTNHHLFEELNVIGQLHKAYILCQSPSGLYIIDQHAAEERYHYEMIRNSILNNDSLQSDLLMPLTITSTIAAVSKIDELNEMLLRYLSI